MSRTTKKIIDLIALLRDRTVERGFTETEALQAAEKLAGLLSEHDLTLDEVELRSSPFAKPEASFDGDVGERVWKIASALAELTGSRFWTTPNGVVPVRITFFGLEHETQVASYLLEICARAMRDQTANAERDWILYTPSARRRRRHAYLDGMADRLASRILALKPKRQPGTGLVLVKEGLIDDELKRLNIRFKPLRSRSSNEFDEAYEVGLAAGDRVPLDPGLKGPSRTMGLIGDGKAA